MALTDIKKEIQKENYSAAIALMEDINEQEKTAEFYLLRAICIQLLNGSNLSEDDAEFSLRKAIELEPRSKEAKLELAYFLLNKRHDPSSAKKIFLEVLEDMRDSEDIPIGISNFVDYSLELHETNNAFINSLRLQADAILSNLVKK